MTVSLTIAAPMIAMRLQIARALDIDAENVLQRAGIDLEILANPFARLSLEQDNAVWRALIEETNNPAIGLQFGQYMKLPGLGIVGYIMMNVKTAACQRQ